MPGPPTKGFYNRHERGWLVLPTRIVEEEAGERRTPIFEHAHQRSTGEGWRDAVFRHPGQASPVDCGLDHEIEVIDEERPANRDRIDSQLLPLTLDMAELQGNEKHVSLSEALPANATRPGTIRNGDLMLYGSNTVVVFYLTFDSSDSYTRPGRVDDPAGLAQALGRRGVRVAFSKD